jgi:hypothetical protein
MTENKQIPFAAAPVKEPLSPEEAKKPNEGTVMMMFPRAVRLSTIDGPVDFRAGINEVPAHLADQPWLKHNGVKRQGAKEPAPAGSWRASAQALPRRQDVSMTEHHVDFLRHNGYKVTDVAAAQQFYEGLPPDEREGFMKEATDWEGSETNQYTLQRRVQDREAGATESAPPNHKGADKGPEPVTVNDLIAEGSALGRGQSEGSAGQGRDLEFERAHPGSFNRGVETGKPAAETGKPVGTATTLDDKDKVGKDKQAQTTSTAKPPETKK